MNPKRVISKSQIKKKYLKYVKVIPQKTEKIAIMFNTYRSVIRVIYLFKLSAFICHNFDLIFPLVRYLHEERLEVQVWVTFNAHDSSKKRPAHRDKLIGSAFIPLHGLADTRRRQHRIR
jgi:hypothetical protein